jgi:hypothetical protein
LSGLDRLGKSTLISNIQHNFGFYQYIHYEKPKKLDIYKNALKDYPGIVSELYMYQHESFANGFGMIETVLDNSSATHLNYRPRNIIFDRFHLGEYVYSPLYRGYDGSYVFNMERAMLNNSAIDKNDVKLILLSSSNFDFIGDDGLSFDPRNKETEDRLFKEAFYMSSFTNKVIVDIHDGSGRFKDPVDIFNEAFA